MFRAAAAKVIVTQYTKVKSKEGLAWLGLAWLAPTILHTSAYENGTDRRFRNVGNYKPDAGELP